MTSLPATSSIVNVGVRILLASASFWFGMPLWVALLDRDEHWGIHVIWEYTGVYIFLWFLLMIPCLVCGILLVGITGKKRWTTRMTIWPPVIIVIVCLTTAVLDPQRVEDRFSKDWKIPWPTSATQVELMLGRGWWGQHRDRYHFYCNPADTEKLLASKPFEPVDQATRLNLASYILFVPKWVTQEKILAYDWFYAAPAQSSDHPNHRSGKSFLLITNQARNEVFLVLDYHD